jgi:hypothetical protein
MLIATVLNVDVNLILTFSKSDFFQNYLPLLNSVHQTHNKISVFEHLLKQKDEEIFLLRTKLNQ